TRGLRPNDLTLAAAAFLNQVLDLDDDTTTLANDLSAIKKDQNAAIFTIQLESSVGLAAFLVYTYILDATGGDGRTGKELYDAGLETLQQAAARNTPGPRAVAHAESDVHGFILATTPGTYRALTGEPRKPAMEPALEDLPVTASVDQVRSDAAEELHKLLREANEQAVTWLDAIQSASRRGNDDLISFSEAETALALFLLDDESIGDLLRALNVLVATAQQQTAEAMYPENQDDPSGTDPATGTWPRRDR
ncbi:MAG TPA: hypothetical protein VNZ58_00700, partial [Thermomicrobiales bacterium]|nr:hypothetical protein [Thermomicrobiales bacterium]